MPRASISPEELSSAARRLDAVHGVLGIHLKGTEARSLVVRIWLDTPEVRAAVEKRLRAYYYRVQVVPCDPGLASTLADLSAQFDRRTKEARERAVERGHKWSRSRRSRPSLV